MACPCGAETLVVDHGKIYLSEHLLACANASHLDPAARPLTPTDRRPASGSSAPWASAARGLPGYKGPDVYSRGADPEACAYFFIDELEQIIGSGRRRSTTAAMRPGRAGAPRCAVAAEMFEAAGSADGCASRPIRARVRLLATAWRTIQHYGVEVHGLRYNGPASTPTGTGPARTPACMPALAGALRPRRHLRLYFCDPVDDAWHTLAWEHAADIDVPFSLKPSPTPNAWRWRRAACRRAPALAELLERFGAGLVRNPSSGAGTAGLEQREARLAAGAADVAES